jgi:protein-disulfide isomerase
MLLNRNNSCNTTGGCTKAVWVAIIILLGVIVFGARNKIRTELQAWVALDKSQIEAVVRDYIQNNPRAIIQSVEDMQKREYDDGMKQAQMKIQDKQNELQSKDSAVSLVAGNVNGDIVIPTFLDYRCGYCKKVNNTLKVLIAKDPNVKIVFKELPILGPQSQRLSQMALAVYFLDKTKYMDFHNALMDSTNLDDKNVEMILQKLNLDPLAVKELMKDARVQKELEATQSLAAQLNIRGTPAFIIGDEIIPGAIDLNGFMEKIKVLRAKNENK